MARPKTDGLLYFSFDTDFFYADNRIRTLRAKFGSDGLVFYIYLLTEIYRNGYYLRWNEESEDNAITDLNLTEGLIKQILTFLINRSLLTSILVNSDTIITAPGIQKRYQEAAKSKRRDVLVNEQIWLLNKEETAPFIKFTQNESKSGKNESKSGKNESKSGKNPTKEIKENKIKGNKNNITGACVRFEEFWNSYPKQTHRMLAEQAYCALVASGITEDVLITASGNYAEYCNIKHTQKDFICNPDNWLNKSKWVDYTAENYKKPIPAKKETKNKFNDFPQRSYDFDALEKQALRGQDSG